MMLQESQKKVGDDKDSMLTRLSELCRSTISGFNSGGTIASTSSPKTNSTHGKELNEGIYLFHEPQGRKDVEIVFIHGLEFHGSKEGYWKTWLARDGTQDNCWPETWLVEEFPQARILSLSYDANVVRTSTSGRMDPYSLGESLVQQMTHFDVGIGQNDCPVVFVCHSFGGLVAKQIVVIGSHNFQGDTEVQNLLRNLRAFHFYATPHAGVQVDVLPMNPFTSKGACMHYLEAFCPEVGRLNSDFERVREKDSNGWICFNVCEMQATSQGRVVVPEASARHPRHGYMGVLADHFDICKPQSKTNSSYQSLMARITEVIKVHEKKQQPRLLELPKKLVGMDDMQTLICEKLRSKSIIGLVGMGGIGKTTISKSVFNSQAKSYDKTCFLQDVRPDDLASAKRQLFEEICGEKVDSTCVSQVQLERIQQCIMKSRVLLVIDDVKNCTTLKTLQVPKFQSLSSGSRVIVTCRNRQDLDGLIDEEELEHVEIIDMELLNDAQALELFRYHAFHGIEGGDDEMKDFEVLVVNVAKACCGLPLSLEVIGQHLHKQRRYSIGKQKEIWEEALTKLCTAQSFDGGTENERLWKRLMISYDDLDNDHKRMFLDFACFFCEKSCSLSDESIEWIWHSPSGLKILCERSLIKFGESYVRRHSYTIHDQLRDMGRRIVKDLSLKRSHESLSKVTRLWEFDDIERFLEDDKGSRTIEGISLQEFGWRLVAPPSQANPNAKGEMTIQRFDSLRLLNLMDCRIEVVEFFLGKCWKKLSWLSLAGIEGKVIPQAIERIGCCTGLRVLQLKYCYFLEELPASIGKLVDLRELDLSWCKILRSLPREIGFLKQLRRLQLLRCKTLKEVPSCVSQLTKLEYLGLNYCSSLVSMVEFERQMDHLMELDLGNCQSLRLPFKSLGKLHRVQTLNMSACENLVIENPSESFRQLSQLQELNLSLCYNFIPGLSRDNCTGELAKGKVESLWNPIVKIFSSHLRELKLPSISTIGLPMYPNLKVLWIWNGFHLEELPECLGDLTQLQSLIVSDALLGVLKKLPTSLSRLVNLESLCLDHMKKLEGLLDMFGQLCSLRILEIGDMEKVEELPSSLGQLIHLEHLELTWCMKLKRLPGSFTNLTRLTKLNLKGCAALEMMDDQELFLQKLKQHGCAISTKIPKWMTLSTNY